MHCLNVHRTKHLEKVHNLILFGSLQTIAKILIVAQRENSFSFKAHHDCVFLTHDEIRTFIPSLSIIVK